MQASSRHAIIYTTLLLTLGVGSMALAGSLDDTVNKQRDVVQALHVNPSDENLTIQLANLAMETGEYQLAIAQMERLITTQPANSEIRLKLGILYYMIGAYDTSRSYLQPLNDPATHGATISAQAERYLVRM